MSSGSSDGPDRLERVARPSGRLRVVSACAGDGRDILEVLASREDAERVSVVLLETDPELARLAERTARLSRLGQVEVRQLDAGTTNSYAGAVPADLVMMCGVFGNVTDEDLRRWFRESGFQEVAFDAPDDAMYCVANRFPGPPEPVAP